MSAIWQSFIVLIQESLNFFDATLSGLGVPYSFGFAIILFTVLVKAVTYPLNVKQIRASKAQQELQPKLKALQKKHGDDREAMARAQMELYKEHGINPLGGCLPILVQMPIWFGLYRALFTLAQQPDTPLKQAFLWIPSLAGPVKPIEGGFTGGIEWLWPPTAENVDFLGWPSAIGYMVLPILLVVSQLYTQRMMMPKTDDPQQKMMGQVMSFMPIMFGYFALVVPSGLSLYWFTSNILTMIQQYFMMKEREKDPTPTKTPDAEAASDGQIAGAKLEVSPATAAIENASDSTKQVKSNASRKTRSKRKRKRRK